VLQYSQIWRPNQSCFVRYYPMKVRVLARVNWGLASLINQRRGVSGSRHSVFTMDCQQVLSAMLCVRADCWPKLTIRGSWESHPEQKLFRVQGMSLMGRGGVGPQCGPHLGPMGLGISGLFWQVGPTGFFVARDWLHRSKCSTLRCKNLKVGLTAKVFFTCPVERLLEQRERVT